MKKYYSKLANQITPYVAGEQPQGREFIKLNTNENPYAPSPKVKVALKSVDFGRLKLYSDPENVKLKTALANAFNLQAENVFVGNGSDEVIAFCFPAFFDTDGAGIAFSDITYSFYPVWASLYNIKQVILPLKKDFSQDIAAYKSTNAQGIIIANPNAPTGIALKTQQIREILQANQDKIVIIDEAYTAFSEHSAVELIKEFDNLLVVQTFSKSYALAGIRCGYALGNPELIAALTKIKHSFNSYTVNSVTESLAVSAISDLAYYQKTAKKVIKTRNFVVKSLKMQGFKVLPSGANFIFARPPAGNAAEIYQKLKDAGVLVRHFAKPKISEWLRISIGTKEDMQKFVEILQNL